MSKARSTPKRDPSEVTPEQRFTRANPCPICDGGKDMPQGQGVRCYGFRAKDGHGVICTRVESDYEAGVSGGWFHPMPSDEHSNGAAPTSGEIVATYVYEDEQGVPLFEVCRLEDKAFRQRRPGATRWDISGVRRVLYHLPQVLSAVARGEVIYVAEGEKDVHALEDAGVAATCNPMGAEKWKDEYSEALRGADVVVIQDRDEPGEKHARAVRRSLLGVASSVRVVEARSGKDAADHLQAGRTLDDFVPADRFERTDLGMLMREGMPEREWLVDGVLLKGKSHALIGDSGTGKTLFVLALIVPLLNNGVTVAYFDEENGADEMRRRLLSLNADPGAISRHFAYFAFSSPTLDEADDLVAEVVALNASLVVFDSAADHYVNANLDENSNQEMTKWAKALPERLSRQHDIAALVLEHVPLADKTKERGASAKRAKVDASWSMAVEREFDASTTGQIKLTRRKNRVGCLPQEHVFEIGGGVFRRSAFDPREAEWQIARSRQKKKSIITALRKHGSLTQNKLEQLVPGTAKETRQLAKELATTLGSGVKPRKGARGAIEYYLVDTEEAS